MANAENGSMYDRIKNSLALRKGVVVGEAERLETVLDGATGSKSFVATIFIAPEQPIDINTEPKSVEEQLFAMDDIDRFNEASSRLIQDVQPVFQRLHT